MVAVRSGSSTLFSIRLDLTLDGPTRPGTRTVTGSFEIGFIFTVTISVSFDVTFGDERNTYPRSPYRVRPLIEAALRHDGNWRAAFDGSARGHVTPRELPAQRLILLPPWRACRHPEDGAAGRARCRASVRARSRAAPFSRSSTSSSAAGVGEPPRRRSSSRPPQFLELSDAEKLSRRCFEPFDAGVEIAGGDQPRADFQRARRRGVRGHLLPQAAPAAVLSPARRRS